MGIKTLAEEFVITIDGPAGSGKSTVAKELAKKLGLSYLDTGAMYRAITLKALEKNISPQDEKELNQLLKNTTLLIEDHPHGCRILLDGQDVSEQIRQPHISRQVSGFAKNPFVRSALCQWQRKLARNKKIIVEGRDMGTVVFPHAEVKFFLDASLEERARRRQQELQNKGANLSYQKVKEEILHRDQSDIHRKTAPLKQAKDAIYVDTTQRTLPEVIEHLKKIIEKKLNKQKK
ncbi:MAG: (d)CMP kinase [Planctomycetota bacterium]|nr:MAG: (d)CMP kinase [Planctomycetota bacterium]